MCVRKRESERDREKSFDEFDKGFVKGNIHLLRKRVRSKGFGDREERERVKKEVRGERRGKRGRRIGEKTEKRERERERERLGCG